MNPPKRASTTISTLKEQRAKVASWVEQNVLGTAIHQALQRQHGWTGSYSSVRPMVAGIRSTMPPEITCHLEFAPGEAAQVDSGAGPILLHPDGKPRRTWAFVMTLAHSRHQCLAFVWDQTAATLLGCHRRAFEWFAGVPQRIAIDNAKCAITRACAQDPSISLSFRTFFRTHLIGHDVFSTDALGSPLATTHKPLQAGTKLGYLGDSEQSQVGK